VCSARSCQPVTLASGLAGPDGLAADSKGIYWTDQTGGAPRVMRASVTGAGATRIAPDLHAGGADNPLLANGTYLIYATENTNGTSSPNGKLRRVQSGTSNVVDVTTGIAAGPVGIDATHAYYFDENDDLVHQVGLDGSGSRAVSPVQVRALAMQVDATSVYFLDSFNAVGTLLLANGAGTTLKPDVSLYSFSLAIDAKNLFVFSAAGELVRIPKTLQGAPALVAPLTGSGAQFGNAAMTADSSFVYVAQPDGVYRVASSGGVPALVASANDYPTRIVLSGGAVYWIDPGTGSGADAAIKKLAVFGN